MSEEQLKAFIAKVQADPSLLEQLKAEGADPVAIAKAAGFSITTEDLKEQPQTLSDKELEGVAGGAWVVPCTTKAKRIGGNCWTNNVRWTITRGAVITTATAYTLKALALAGAFYFFNDFLFA